VIRPALNIIIFCIVAVFFSKSASAQDRTALDSFLSQVTDTTGHRDLAELYYYIAEEYYYLNPDSALTYTRLYLEAAENANDSVWTADALYWMGDMFFYTNLDSALVYCEKFLQASEDLNDTAWVGYAYELFAYVYYEMGEIGLALENYETALEYFLLVDDQYKIGACYNNVGYTITYGSDQPTGMSYFIRALEIAEEIQDTSLISDVSSNIAYFYDCIKDYPSAYKYYERPLDLDLSRNDSIPIAMSYASLAYTNVELKNYNDAEHQLEEAKRHIPHRLIPYQLAQLYSSIAECYLKWGNADSAAIYVEQFEKILEQNKYVILNAYLYQQKGFLSYLKKEYENCIRYLDESISRFTEINSPESFAITYAKKAEAYSAMRMYKQAFNSQQLSNAFLDSLKYGVVAAMLSKLEQDRLHERELQQNRLEIELATQKIENTNIRIRSNLRTAIIAIVLLLVLVGIVIYFLFSIRKKNEVLASHNELINDQKILLEKNIEKLKISEEDLKELNATKDKFFSIIAHDLRNPFNSIIGFSDMFIKNPDRLRSKDVMLIIENLNKTANYGFSLLQNLLEWSLSQTGALIPKPEKVLLDKTLKNQISLFDPITSSKNIALELQGKSVPPVFADANMVTTILRNLIHNAVKFSFNDSVVKINVYQRDKYLVTSVEDQGIGISQEELSRLFSIDGQVKKVGTNNETGSGLGLILCKEFVEKNKGEIWVESQEPQGCKFSFSLPLFEEA